ncbi:His/Gly/Thr/Pro-type tRNA ligase C-terminal domain-containing protein, partial [Bacillus spizizenii]
LLVGGDQEAEHGAVNVRKYGEQNSETLSLDDFVKKAVAEATK